MASKREYHFECDSCHGTVVLNPDDGLHPVTAAKGAVAGAAIGSIIPIVGTIFGGIVGAGMAGAGKRLNHDASCRDCGARYSPENTRLLRQKAMVSAPRVGWLEGLTVKMSAATERMNEATAANAAKRLRDLENTLPTDSRQSNSSARSTSAPGDATRNASPPPSNDTNIAVQITRLAELRAAGVLTEEEFSRAKQRVLDVSTNVERGPSDSTAQRTSPLGDGTRNAAPLPSSSANIEARFAKLQAAGVLSVCGICKTPFRTADPGTRIVFDPATGAVVSSYCSTACLIAAG